MDLLFYNKKVFIEYKYPKVIDLCDNIYIHKMQISRHL